MPMDFPDFKSLKITAKLFKFRKPNPEETEDDFRVALADHVKPLDRIESFEIRFKVGWDMWNDEQKKESLFS